MWRIVGLFLANLVLLWTLPLQAQTAWQREQIIREWAWGEGSSGAVKEQVADSLWVALGSTDWERAHMAWQALYRRANCARLSESDVLRARAHWLALRVDGSLVHPNLIVAALEALAATELEADWSNQPDDLEDLDQQAQDLEQRQLWTASFEGLEQHPWHSLREALASLCLSEVWQSKVEVEWLSRSLVTWLGPEHPAKLRRLAWSASRVFWERQNQVEQWLEDFASGAGHTADSANSSFLGSALSDSLERALALARSSLSPASFVLVSEALGAGMEEHFAGQDGLAKWRCLLAAAEFYRFGSGELADLTDGLEELWDAGRVGISERRATQDFLRGACSLGGAPLALECLRRVDLARMQRAEGSVWLEIAWVAVTPVELLELSCSSGVADAAPSIELLDFLLERLHTAPDDWAFADFQLWWQRLQSGAIVFDTEPSTEQRMHIRAAALKLAAGRALVAREPAAIKHLLWVMNESEKPAPADSRQHAQWQRAQMRAFGLLCKTSTEPEVEAVLLEAWLQLSPRERRYSLDHFPRSRSWPLFESAWLQFGAQVPNARAALAELLANSKPSADLNKPLRNWLAEAAKADSGSADWPSLVRAVAATSVDAEQTVQALLGSLESSGWKPNEANKVAVLELTKLAAGAQVLLERWDELRGTASLRLRLEAALGLAVESPLAQELLMKRFESMDTKLRARSLKALAHCGAGAGGARARDFVDQRVCSGGLSSTLSTASLGLDASVVLETFGVVNAEGLVVAANSEDEFRRLAMALGCLRNLDLVHLGTRALGELDSASARELVRSLLVLCEQSGNADEKLGESAELPLGCYAAIGGREALREAELRKPLLAALARALTESPTAIEWMGQTSGPIEKRADTSWLWSQPLSHAEADWVARAEDDGQLSSAEFRFRGELALGRALFAAPLSAQRAGALDVALYGSGKWWLCDARYLGALAKSAEEAQRFEVAGEFYAAALMALVGEGPRSRQPSQAECRMLWRRGLLRAQEALENWEATAQLSASLVRAVRSGALRSSHLEEYWGRFSGRLVVDPIGRLEGARHQAWALALERAGRAAGGLNPAARQRLEAHFDRADSALGLSAAGRAAQVRLLEQLAPSLER